MQSVERQSGRTPDELRAPPLPEELQHVWQWFCELDRARGNNGFGPNAIGYAELAAWREMTGCRPTKFEFDLIARLDVVALQHYSKKP